MATTTPPTRTREELLAASRRSAEIRKYRTQIKRMVRGNLRSVTKVLYYHHWPRDLTVLQYDRAQPLTDVQRKALSAMRVRRLLEARWGIGRVTSARALEECRIPLNRRIGGLAPQERGRLRGWLWDRRIV